MGAGNCPSSSSGFDSDSHASPQHSKMLSLEYGGRPTMLSLRVRVITKISITKSPTLRGFSTIWFLYGQFSTAGQISINLQSLKYHMQRIPSTHTQHFHVEHLGMVLLLQVTGTSYGFLQTSPTLGDVTIVTSPVTIDLGTKTHIRFFRKPSKKRQKKSKNHILFMIYLCHLFLAYIRIYYHICRNDANLCKFTIVWHSIDCAHRSCRPFSA